MPTLEFDNLVFRFPQIEPDAHFSISFMRTLRIPDTDRTYALPPGFGEFPLRHVEDYAGRLPNDTLDRGGVVVPMWQAEAMWMLFKNDGPDWECEDTLSGHVSDELGMPYHWERLRSGSGLPVAVKIAAGKVNAVSGEAWRPGLHQDPQDYVVSPLQPWLDGFAIEKGTVRQFIAMPLGEGYSVEEQVTGNSEWGGIQISVTPLKATVWKNIKELAGQIQDLRSDILQSCREVSAMGMGAGGRMHQEVYEDIFGLDDWDWAETERVFVSLVHAKDWKAITGEAAPNEPPSATDYAAAGLPWFDYYGKGVVPLPGSAELGKVESVANVFKNKTGAQMPSSNDVDIGKPIVLGAGAKGARSVRSSSLW